MSSIKALHSFSGREPRTKWGTEATGAIMNCTGTSSTPSNPLSTIIGSASIGRSGNLGQSTNGSLAPAYKESHQHRPISQANEPVSHIGQPETLASSLDTTISTLAHSTGTSQDNISTTIMTCTETLHDERHSQDTAKQSHTAEETSPTDSAIDDQTYKSNMKPALCTPEEEEENHSNNMASTTADSSQMSEATEGNHIAEVLAYIKASVASHIVTAKSSNYETGEVSNDTDTQEGNLEPAHTSLQTNTKLPKEISAIDFALKGTTEAATLSDNPLCPDADCDTSRPVPLEETQTGTKEPDRKTMPKTREAFVNMLLNPGSLKGYTADDLATVWSVCEPQLLRLPLRVPPVEHVGSSQVETELASTIQESYKAWEKYKAAESRWSLYIDSATRSTGTAPEILEGYYKKQDLAHSWSQKALSLMQLCSGILPQFQQESNLLGQLTRVVVAQRMQECPIMATDETFEARLLDGTAEDPGLALETLREIKRRRLREARTLLKKGVKPYRDEERSRNLVSVSSEARQAWLESQAINEAVTRPQAITGDSKWPVTSMQSVQSKLMSIHQISAIMEGKRDKLKLEGDTQSAKYTGLSAHLAEAEAAKEHALRAVLEKAHCVKTRHAARSLATGLSLTGILPRRSFTDDEVDLVYETAETGVENAWKNVYGSAIGSAREDFKKSDAGSTGRDFYEAVAHLRNDEAKQTEMRNQLASAFTDMAETFNPGQLSVEELNDLHEHFKEIIARSELERDESSIVERFADELKSERRARRGARQG